MAKNIFINLEAKGLGVVYKLIKKYPAEATRLLAEVGYETKSTLVSGYLSGQDLNLTKLRDRKGRRTASYSFDYKKGSVLIRSYPVNLFERGRKLRDGTRQPGKKIITGKLPGRALGILNRRAKGIFDKLAKVV